MFHFQFGWENSGKFPGDSVRPSARPAPLRPETGIFRAQLNNSQSARTRTTLALRNTQNFVQTPPESMKETIEALYNAD